MQKTTEKWSKRMQRKNLITEFKNLSKELGIMDVMKGFHHKETITEAILKKPNEWI